MAGQVQSILWKEIEETQSWSIERYPVLYLIDHGFVFCFGDPCLFFNVHHPRHPAHLGTKQGHMEYGVERTSSSCQGYPDGILRCHE